MCGLAGFARHPEGKGLRASMAALTEMIKGIEHRGHHATGIACVGGDNDFLWKIAQRSSALHESGTLHREISKAGDGVLSIIGHTRYATLPNAHLDQAAHPFRFGRVVGAHNGMLRNWTELRAQYGKNDEDAARWIVDSEAAFYLLDRFDDPVQAIAQIRGSYALTWAKDGMIYFVRNTNPLVCAYVKKWRALYWCSERTPLEAALRHVGVKANDIEWWIPNTNEIYCFNPTSFDANGSHPTKVACPDPNTYTVAPAPKQKRKKISTGSPYDDYEMSPFETRRTLEKQETFGDWQRRRAAENTQLELPATTQRKKPATDLASLINVVLDEVQQLKGIIESQQAEIDHLFAVVEDAGLLDVAFTQAIIQDAGDGEDYALPDKPTF